MDSRDHRLTQMSLAIIGFGALGVVGASLGRNVNIAAPALLWAATVFDIFWGIVTIVYVRFMNSTQEGALSRARVIHVFHGGFIVTNLVFIVLSVVAVAIDHNRESRWLYVPLVALLVCEILMLVWVRTLVRSTTGDRSTSSDAEK